MQLGIIHAQIGRNTLCEVLANKDWSFIDNCCPTLSTKVLTDIILEEAKRFIPHRIVRVLKSSHPWLNEECKRLVRDKHRAEGTGTYEDEVKRCSAGLGEAYQRYVQKTREDLKDCKKGSRRWWKLASALMNKPEKNCSIPALKENDGTWALTPLEKAELLAKTFEAKVVLSDFVMNEFSLLQVSPDAMGSCCLLRLRAARKI